MASSKETPRQRMVGMMYLVLTALLALQVSSAMIFKFQALNESLQSAAGETSNWNDRKLIRIADEIKRRGNKAEEVKLLRSVRMISDKSRETISYIEGIKKELIKETGGYEPDGSLKGAKEETKVEVTMIGANRNGKAYGLKRKLDEYVKFMNEHSGLKAGRMALDGREDPLFRNNEEQRNKDFAELNFGQTPLVAALAILSEFQSHITTMEATTLAMASEKIGLTDFKFDKLQPMVSPDSRVVAAGTRYEAKVFVTATSSTQKPEMEAGSSTLTVDSAGIGTYSFIASGGNYVNGLAKKVWTGKIRMKKPDGGDTVMIVSEEYYVAQPVIQAQSASMPMLYRNCGNKLNIQVPALGNTYNPRFTAEGASVIPGAEKGLVTVIPTAARVKIKISSEGNYIGDKEYRVGLIPSPSFEVKINNKKVDDPLKGVPALTVRNISVRALPEKEFARLLPDDARYQVVEYNLILADKRTASRRERVTSEFFNLTPWINDMKPGDRLIVEVLKVKRKNYKGEWEEVTNLENKYMTIPLN